MQAEEKEINNVNANGQVSERTAIVLFNIGGPLRTKDIRPYLFNFFSDKNIIRAPWPVRKILALLISWRRGKGAALAAYQKMGGKSPLLENTQAQADTLQKILKERYRKEESGDVRVFVAMRYWHPFASETLDAIKAFGPDRIVALPLYPQFSTATTRSSLEDWDKTMKGSGISAPVQKICCYPLQENFISASAQNVMTTLAAAKKENPGKDFRVLFSAHGLPKKVIADGDPYQWQCEESAAAIARKAGLSPQEWQICYQSRVGPLEWIGPSTDEAIRNAGKEQKGIVIYPHAFVSEHVETLVEIGDEFCHLAQELGVPAFYRVPTVGINTVFIEGLAGLVHECLDNADRTVFPKNRICPSRFKRCHQEKTTGHD